MGGEWRETTLGKVCKEGGGNIQTGPFGSQLHKSDYVQEGVPSIMPVNIGDNRINTESIARISEEDAERLAKYRVYKGDIVYSRRGDVERRALVREAENGWLCGTGCLRVRFGEGEVHPLFASYQLGYPKTREWIVRHAIGATMPNLNTGILSALPFVVPPLPEQKTIAHILGSLDDKIELNRRMNETLEAMAQALFQCWFVDFDPVIDKALAAGKRIPEELKAKAKRRRALGEKRRPLPKEIEKLFPDEFEHTEEMGWVPKGWEVSPIGDLLTLAYGKSLSANSRIPGPYPVYGSGGVSGYHELYLVAGPGIVVGRKGSVGSVYWVEEDFFPIDTVFYVENRSAYPLHWLYRLLSALNISSLAADSAVPGVNRNAVNFQNILKPPVNLVVQYWEISKSGLEKIRQNREQSETLEKLRDTLLPKLISGELRVPDAEKLAAEML